MRCFRLLAKRIFHENSTFVLVSWGPQILWPKGCASSLESRRKKRVPQCFQAPESRSHANRICCRSANAAGPKGFASSRKARKHIIDRECLPGAGYSSLWRRMVRPLAMWIAVKTLRKRLQAFLQNRCKNRGPDMLPFACLLFLIGWRYFFNISESADAAGPKGFASLIRRQQKA